MKMILTFLLVIGALVVVLFMPIPYYQSKNPICKPGQVCRGPGWYWGESLWLRFFYRVKSNSAAIVPASLRICPKTEWVNCMPIMTPEDQKSCTKEYLDWAKNTCPGFKGVTY